MRTQRGFTLIELMIVVAVIGILAAVAFPSYEEYIQRTRRADAKLSLDQLAMNQEKWRANNVSYSSALAEVWNTSVYGTKSFDGNYDMAIVGTSDATGFNATSAPVSGGSQDGDKCGTFAIDQDGPDDSGTYADEDICWNR